MGGVEKGAGRLTWGEPEFFGAGRRNGGGERFATADVEDNLSADGRCITALHHATQTVTHRCRWGVLAGHDHYKRGLDQQDRITANA